VEVDGLLNLDEFAEQTGLELPEGPYETAAGYVLSAFGALPSAGDTVQVGGRTITVTELDGRRIARLRVTANVPAPSGQAPSGQAQPGPAAPPPASSASTSANGVSPGQVRLDSEAPRE
jgi:putative hemolysin